MVCVHECKVQFQNHYCLSIYLTLNTVRKENPRIYSDFIMQHHNILVQYENQPRCLLATVFLLTSSTELCNLRGKKGWQRLDQWQ